jgi:hypothetical protein
VYETLDKPVRVELVRHLSWSGGRFSLGPTASFHLHVETTPPFDEPTTCESVDLSENEKGTVVAFRCKHEGAWQAIRLGEGGAHVLDCSTNLGTEKKPDYTRLKSIEKAAPAILDCHERGDGTQWRAYSDLYDAVAREIRESGGAAAVRAFLAESSGRAIPDEAVEDPWVHVVLELSKSERADVETDLCPALLKTGGDDAFVRAARLCPLGDPRIATAALDRVRIEFLPSATPRQRVRRDSPLEWALVIALRSRSSEAGALACTFATAVTESSWRRDLAIAAIGASNTACPAAVVSKGCGASFDCDGGLCSAAELRPELDAWLATDADGGVRAFGPKRPTDEHALLAADYAAGALPRDLVLRNARRHYTIDAGAAPSCTDRLALGAPCSCASLDDALICDLPLDGGRLERFHCSVRADDRALVVGYVEHACIAAPDGGACTSDDDCCDGVACVKPDGGWEGACRRVDSTEH